MDGAVVLDRAAVKAASYPGPTYVVTGIRFRQVPPALWTAWFDDVAIRVE